MNKKFIFSSALLVLSAVSNAQTQDSIKTTILSDVVVSDTKFALSKEKSSKIIEVITSKDLEAKQGLSLATILSQVAGLEVNGNQSFAGKNLGYYIRGGRNRQTAIYIDGVPVTDASGINLEYDLRLIAANQVAKIEIMKGASSTLYGTGAATGVINITLKKAEKQGISGNGYLQLSTQNTATTDKHFAQDFNQGMTISGKNKGVSFLTAINSTESNGMSEAAGDQFEKDNFSRVNLLQKVGFKASKNLELSFFGNYDRIKNNFDSPFNGTLAASDDLSNSSFSEQFRVGFLPKYTFSKGEIVVNAGASTINRSIAQSNSWSGGIDSYHYKGITASVDAFSKYQFSKTLFVVLGTQMQYHAMGQQDAYTHVKKENAKFSLLDPYFSVVYNSNFGFNLNAGMRLNNHSEYGSQLVYNFNPSYVFAALPLKIITSYSTAFITPSLYQLYGPYGNLNLTPEKNATAEAGFEYQFVPQKVQFSAIGFYRNEQNTIGFYFNPDTFVSNYTNFSGEYNAKGLETTMKYTVSEALQLSGNYTFTQVEATLDRLIPKHKGTINLQYVAKKWKTNLDYQYLSTRNDAYYDATAFATQSVVLDAYQLFNATFSYNLIPNRLQLMGAVTNIGNADFQEAIGYATRGRNYKLGLQFYF